jgi:hypothetical protein
MAIILINCKSIQEDHPNLPQIAQLVLQEEHMLLMSTIIMHIQASASVTANSLCRLHFFPILPQ